MILFAAALLCLPNAPAEWTAQAPSQKEINGAIESGVEFLLGAQQLDGSWEYLNWEYQSGHTALAAYALLKSGVPPDHPAIRQAVSYLQAHRPSKTYAVSCLLLALQATRDPAYQPWMSELVDDLLSWQEGGLFLYPDHRAPDLSNALFASLGLRAAARSGVKVPAKAWQRLLSAAIACQEPKSKVEGAHGTREIAGFAYVAGQSAYGSMTTAGLTISAICREELGRKLSRGLAKKVDEAEQLALAWLDHHFTVTGNPLAPVEKWHHYFLYGLERVGSLREEERLGEHYWYREGAAYLVGAQRPHGAWRGNGRENWDEVDTCLALLFLNRATARAAVTGEEVVQAEVKCIASPHSPVTICARPDSPTALWVSLKEYTSRWAWPGEEDAGLRVQEVRYLARKKGIEEAEAIASAPGDAARPAGSERFAVQHQFPDPGEWLLRAEVVVLLPPAGEKDEPEEKLLHSGELAIFIKSALGEDRLAYPADSGRNLLRGMECEVSASSQEREDRSPAYLVDGFLGRAWTCLPGDEDIWVKVELAKAARADTILLSHTSTKAFHRHLPRPSTVEVRLNGRDEPLRVEMDPDVTRKTVVELGKIVAVKRVEVRIREAATGELGRDAFGFSELELQRRG